jgi:hypothetical protein
MQTVKTWLTAQRCGLTVASTPRNEVVFELGKKTHVYVSNRGTYACRLATLLHECGHVIIWQRRRRRKSARVFGASFAEWMYNRGRCRARTRRAALATLQEEMAAWELGEQLARRLNIRFSVKTFEKVRTRAVCTYLPGAPTPRQR